MQAKMHVINAQSKLKFFQRTLTRLAIKGTDKDQVEEVGLMRKQGNQKMKSILHNLGYNSAKKLAIQVREPSRLYSSYYFGT